MADSHFINVPTFSIYICALRLIEVRHRSNLEIAHLYKGMQRMPKTWQIIRIGMLFEYCDENVNLIFGLLLIFSIGKYSDHFSFAYQS